jgi:putative acetyltransferase
VSTPLPPNVQPAAPPIVSIRAATDADTNGLIALIGGVFAAYPGCVLDVDAEEPDLRQIATAYSRRGGNFWVATDTLQRGNIVGCVGFAPTPAVAVVELRKLYVATDYRRRGLARSLLQLVEAVAREHHAQRIELWSDTRFFEGHHFYRAHGFEQLPETRRLFDLSDTTEYYFAKTLV